MSKSKFLPTLLPLCAAVMLSHKALALGVGNAEIDSKLGRPLAVRIPVFSAQGLDENQLILSVKPSFDPNTRQPLSELAGKNIRLRAQLQGDGSGVIYMTTPGPLNEPFLDFMLQVRWPSGQLLREYTLLLDLPDSSAGPGVGALATTAAQAAVTAVAAPPQPRSQSRPPSSSTKSNTIEAAAQYYTTRRGDNLWSIASRLGQARGQSRSSLMEQIFQLNPRAFIRGDRNLLKEAVRLDIAPTNLAAASERSRIENAGPKATSAGTGSSVAVDSGNALVTSANEVQTSSGPSQVAGSIPVPGQAPQPGQGYGGAVASETLVEQSIADVSREAEAVAENIAAMTARLEVLQQRLQALQLEYSRLQDADNPLLVPEQQQAELTRSGAEVLALLQEPAAGQTAMTEAGEIEADRSDQQPSSEASTAVVSQQDIATSQSDSAVESGTAWWKWLAIAIAAGGGLFMLLWRRQSNYRNMSPVPSKEPEYNLFNDFAAPEKILDETASSASSGFAEPAVVDAETALSSEQVSGEEEFDLTALDDLGDELGLSSIAANDELDERVASCIAVGDYAAAQPLLEKLLAEDEDNTALRLQLLDVYARQGLSDEFEALALQLEFDDAEPTVLMEISELRNTLIQHQGVEGSSTAS